MDPVRPLKQKNIGREKSFRVMRRLIVPGVDARGVIPDHEKHGKRILGIIPHVTEELLVRPPSLLWVKKLYFDIFHLHRPEPHRLH